MRLVLFLAGLVALSVLFVQPAAAGCTSLATTADGGDKASAAARSQAGLKEAIAEWASTNRRKVTSISALKAKPNPYWRESVSADLFYRPDIVAKDSYTVCWRGVISVAVCTSGARVCY